MTVGIGVLCENGASAILASDMRATYPSNAVDPNDLVGKQFHFAHIPLFRDVSCAIAGKLGLCTEIAFRLNIEFQKLSKRKKPLTHEHVRDAIDAARWRVLARRRDWVLKTQLNITWNQLLRGKVPHGNLDKAAIDYARALCAGYDFKVQFILCGHVLGTPMFFRASRADELESETSPAVYTIGSPGARAAMSHLNKRGQTLMCGLARSLLHVHEAMEAAREADKEHIGPPAIYAVLTHDRGLWRFKPDSYLLQGWAKAYKNREDTWSLETELAREQVRQQLFKWEGHEGITPSEFPTSIDS